MKKSLKSKAQAFFFGSILTLVMAVAPSVYADPVAEYQLDLSGLADGDPLPSPSDMPPTLPLIEVVPIMTDTRTVHVDIVGVGQPHLEAPIPNHPAFWGFNLISSESTITEPQRISFSDMGGSIIKGPVAIDRNASGTTTRVGLTHGKGDGVPGHSTADGRLIFHDFEIEWDEQIFSSDALGMFTGIAQTPPFDSPIKGTWEAAPGEIGMLSWVGFGLAAIGLIGYHRRKAQSNCVQYRLKQ